jgi:hypothetical protein
MPAGNCGRLDKDQRVIPAKPPPPQAQPEQAVRSLEASIRASEYSELVTEGDVLQHEIASPGEGRPECGDDPEGVTHRV